MTVMPIKQSGKGKIALTPGNTGLQYGDAGRRGEAGTLIFVSDRTWPAMMMMMMIICCETKLQDFLMKTSGMGRE